MKRITTILTILLAVTAVATAQDNPIAVLEFFENDQELTVVDQNGFDVNFYMGMGLSPGDRITTGSTTAEISLQPNGSIIKVAANTEFSIDALQNRDAAETTRLGVRTGRLRMIAARYTERESRYDVYTPNAVAGVRGTDFGVSAIPGEDGAMTEELFVFDGEVIYTNTQTEDAVFVSTGQRVDLGGAEFLPVTMDEGEIASRREDLAFQELDPTTVPGIVVEPEPEVTDVEPEPAPEPPEQPIPEDEPGALDRFFGRMTEITGLEVGSVTINEETYARVVFQPHISVGKLNAAFYFPIIYGENLFDAGDWYEPEGNNEWSFSSDQDWEDEPLVALRDLGTDIALKIRYIEYAERGDKFFLKVGNLSNFTIGQGLLMRNYANDIDFPATRRIGFNTGFDFEKWGFEALVNNLAAPEIYGGRLYFRPAEPVVPAAVGLSAVTDLFPAEEISFQDKDGDPLDAETVARLRAAQDGEPLFLNVGMDVELPVIDREIFSLIGFAEAGGLIPYLRTYTETGGESINSGLKTSALVDFSSGELKNFGWTAGTRGELAFLDYRLQFLSYDGIFRPGFYGPSYDRLRGNYAAETIQYLGNTEADEYQVETMGVAGEAGVDILDRIYFSIGYLWPWERTEDNDWQGSNDDEFSVGLAFKDGFLPFGVTAGAEYRRTHFAATVAGWNEYKDAHLFDANTTLDGYVRYPLTEAIDLEARISTAVLRDEDGDVIYDDDGNPRVAPVLAIQTRIGF